MCVPWLEHVFPAEDSLDLLERKTHKTQNDLNVTVIRLPRIANFTDFDPLESEASVALKYLNPARISIQMLYYPRLQNNDCRLDSSPEKRHGRSDQHYAAAGGTVLESAAFRYWVSNWLIHRG